MARHVCFLTGLSQTHILKDGGPGAFFPLPLLPARRSMFGIKSLKSCCVLKTCPDFICWFSPDPVWIKHYSSFSASYESRGRSNRFPPLNKELLVLQNHLIPAHLQRTWIINLWQEVWLHSAGESARWQEAVITAVTQTKTVITATTTCCFPGLQPKQLRDQADLQSGAQTIGHHPVTSPDRLPSDWRCHGCRLVEKIK